MSVIKIFTGMILLSVILLVLIQCDTPAEPEKDSENKVILAGQVVDKEKATPVEGAIVRLPDFITSSPLLTDSLGRYTYEFESDQTFEIQIFAYKENFRSDTISVLIVPGRTVNVPLLILAPVGEGLKNSGEAASIILASISRENIGVRESGSPETTEITFEIQDSTGIPIDLQHQVMVHFRVGAAPGGGEFIYPESTMTSYIGQATVNLFSGTKSGVVQILAEVQIKGKTLRSQPVPVTIHGGLPDSAHFSVAVMKQNFPGFNIYGLTDVVTAYVGDKYGNPVKPGTAVYFTTTGGLIEASALTNEVGQASVSLISSAPKPYHPELGAGFATVTARTADEKQNNIEAHTIVLFSGIPQISVDPDSISVPNGGSQTFTYFVHDQNKNPLAEYTNIQVAVEAGDVKAVGDINVTLQDTQSKDWTVFSFSLIDARPDTLLPNPVSIKISTSGPNGAAEISLSGVAN